MNNIKTVQQLRDEIRRVRMESDFRKAEIKNSFDRFKSSLSPLSLILSVLGELNQDKMVKTAFSAFEKIKEYFKKKD